MITGDLVINDLDGSMIMVDPMFPIETITVASINLRIGITAQ